MKAIERIALRTNFADVEVAQALYDAKTRTPGSYSMFDEWGFFSVLEEAYDAEAFPRAASSAYETVAKNLAAKGIAFKPGTHPAIEQWTRDLSRLTNTLPSHDTQWLRALSLTPETFRAPDKKRVAALADRVMAENSFNCLPERDIRELNEKIAVLQEIQRRFLEIPKPNNYALVKMEAGGTPPRTEPQKKG